MRRWEDDSSERNESKIQWKFSWNYELRIEKSNRGRLLLKNGEWRMGGDETVGNLMPTG